MRRSGSISWGGALCAAGLLALVSAVLAVDQTKGVTLEATNVATMDVLVKFAIVSAGSTLKLTLAISNTSVGAPGAFSLYTIPSTDYFVDVAFMGSSAKLTAASPAVAFGADGKAAYTVPAAAKFQELQVLVAATAACKAEGATMTSPGCYFAAMGYSVLPADVAIFLRFTGLVTYGADAGTLKFRSPPSLLDIMAAAASEASNGTNANAIFSQAMSPYITGSTYALMLDVSGVDSFDINLYKFSFMSNAGSLMDTSKSAAVEANPLAQYLAIPTPIVSQTVASGATTAAGTWAVPATGLSNGIYAMVARSKSAATPSAGDFALAAVQAYQACSGDCRLLMGTWTATGDDCQGTSDSKSTISVRFSSVAPAGVMVTWIFPGGLSFPCLVTKYTGGKLEISCLSQEGKSDTFKTTTSCINLALSSDGNTAGAAFKSATSSGSIGTCLDTTPAGLATTGAVPACPADKSYTVVGLTRSAVGATLTVSGDPKTFDAKKFADDLKAKLGNGVSKVEVLGVTVGSGRRMRRTALQTQSLRVEVRIVPASGTQASAVTSNFETLANSGQLSSIGGVTVATVQTTKQTTTSTKGGSAAAARPGLLFALAALLASLLAAL
eukprot:tig00000760_g3928.t1